MKKIIVFSIFIFLFSTSGFAKAPNLEEPAPEIPIPVRSPILIVVKGIYPSKEKAQETQKFIQQLLVKTPADGIIASEKLEGFTPGQWVIASAFDSESKARWWMNFSHRNPTLPRPILKKTSLLQESSEIPYFPEAMHEGVHRFYTEKEVLDRISSFPDIAELKQKKNTRFLFTVYPRTGDYTYEVEIMADKGAGQFVAHDFIAVNATDLNHYSRYSENLRAKK